MKPAELSLPGSYEAAFRPDVEKRPTDVIGCSTDWPSIICNAEAAN